jgi:2-amino-4-hydroxy-6-hydroxymethyldihydropteridine diphosphokinase
MEGQYYEVYLSFGSNMGHRAANIQMALKYLDEAGVKLKQSSSFFETEPWGKAGQGEFLNYVAKMETKLSPLGLMSEILTIETMGTSHY